MIHLYLVFAVVFGGVMLFETWWWVLYLVVSSFALMLSVRILLPMYQRLRNRARCAVCTGWSRSVVLTDIGFNQILCAKHSAQQVRIIRMEYEMGLEHTGAGELLAQKRRAERAREERDLAARNKYKGIQW